MSELQKNVIIPTEANWIPATNPPTREDSYLVWIRQGGSILKGRKGFLPYEAGQWKIDSPLVDGEQVDMWADVAPPSWTESPS